MDLLILVTLGTNDKTFIRLIKKIEELKIKGIIEEDIVVQAGYTKYTSQYMQIFDLIDMDRFNKLLEECSLLITHGGVGTIVSGLQKKKKVIAVPRLQKYAEHVNDHQLEIIENFAESGFILPSYDVDKLEEAILKAKTFEPKQYTSNTTNMVELVKSHIERLVK
ncbi:MAG: PssE/Cps14G family polysaccharide biosynthesis glycosyltransferase [Acutalibacteraceae bacterium]|nr:PssE/Cps14G family polysaccharide biosynthesis glycosyltransferase [Acutalibacteraceae bacterium]